MKWTLGILLSVVWLGNALAQGDGGVRLSASADAGPTSTTTMQADAGFPPEPTDFDGGTGLGDGGVPISRVGQSSLWRKTVQE